MKHDDSHMHGQERGPGTSRNINVMFQLHTLSDDMIKIVTRDFMSV